MQPKEENRADEQRDPRHERLCAYVLGELPADERDALEAELARDPALRAERERLERTIGLVQGALGDDAAAGERLPPAATDDLLRRAARPAPVLRFPRRLAGLAAAAAVVAMAFVAWRAAEPGPGAIGLDGDVARAPEAQIAVPSEAEAARTSDARADSLEKVARGGLVDGVEQLGRSVTDLEEPRRQAAGEAGNLLAGAAVRRAEAKDDADAFSAPSAEADGAEAGLEEALQEIGYVDELASRESAAKAGALYDEIAPADQPEEAPLVAERIERLRVLGYDGNPPESAPRAGPAAPPVRAKEEAPSSTGGGGATTPSNEIIGVGGGAGGKFGARFGGRRNLKAAGGSGSASGPGTPGPASGAGPAAGPSGSVALGTRGAPGTTAGPGSLPPGAGARPAEALDALGYVDEDAKGDTDFFLGEAYQARDGLERHRFTFDNQLGLVDPDVLTERVLERCRRRPDERPRDMFFRFWGDNAFVRTHQDRLATLAADVDTASYALARNYLRNGSLPPPAAVRTEEFLNYFRPDVDAPAEGTFAIHTDLAPSRFGPTPDHWLLRVVVRGREVSREERRPLALTIVLDVSGSMKEQDRMELVKYGVRMLLGELDGRDSVAIVTFNRDARILLGATPAIDRGAIETALHDVRPQGSTNAEAGLRLGYELASARFARGASNRVVLFSDGVANVGQTDQDRITRDVAARRDEGIYLNTIGVGMNNHNDVFLEQLANRGDGLCNYVDTPLEARRALVDNFLGAFEPIARDVKLQVEFDPAQVLRWRQLGYENRRVADADFRNDAVDAGEIGSGHQVVALFELERVGGADAEDPLATVRLRWKPPHGDAGAAPETEVATEAERTVRARDAAGSPEAAGPGFLRATLVAQFAEVLRDSVHASGDSWDALRSESAALARELRDPDFDELVELQKQAGDLLGRRRATARSDLRRTLDAVRRNAWLRAELEDLQRDERSRELEELERENRDLERRLNELLRDAIRDRGHDEALRELGEF